MGVVAAAAEDSHQEEEEEVEVEAATITKAEVDRTRCEASDVMRRFASATADLVSPCSDLATMPNTKAATPPASLPNRCSKTHGRTSHESETSVPASSRLRKQHGPARRTQAPDTLAGQRAVSISPLRTTGSPKRRDQSDHGALPLVSRVRPPQDDDTNNLASRTRAAGRPTVVGRTTTTVYYPWQSTFGNLV